MKKLFLYLVFVCWYFWKIFLTEAMEPIASGDGFMQLERSFQYTCWLRDDGTVWCSWSNYSGELGVWFSGMTDTFYQVKGNLFDKKVTHISVWYLKIFALTSDGEVYGWGRNDDGFLGVGNTTDAVITSPEKLDFWGERIVRVYNGQSIVNIWPQISYAVTDNGDLYSWWTDISGINWLWDADVWVVTTTPKKINLQGEKVKEFYQRFSNSWMNMIYIITQSGRVMFWWANDYGIGGIGNTTNTVVATPTFLDFSWAQISKIFINGSQNWYPSFYALSSVWDVYGWGNNSMGGLGVNNMNEYYITSPKKLNFNGDTIISLDFVANSVYAARNKVMYAINSRWEVYTWGENIFQNMWLWPTAPAYVVSPEKMDFWGNKITQIVNVSSDSAHYGFALTDQGEVFTWWVQPTAMGIGANINMYGQLPVKLDFKWEKIVTIVSNYNTPYSWARVFYGITASGKVYVWGYAVAWLSNEQLDTYRQNPIPTQLLIPDTIKSIIYFDEYELPLSYYGITSNGEVYVWWEEAYGNLGQSTESSIIYEPIKLNLEGKITNIYNNNYQPTSGGRYYTSVYALRDDGTLYTWGMNMYLGTNQSNMIIGPSFALTNQRDAENNFIPLDLSLFSSCSAQEIRINTDIFSVPNLFRWQTLTLTGSEVKRENGIFQGSLKFTCNPDLTISHTEPIYTIISCDIGYHFWENTCMQDPHVIIANPDSITLANTDSGVIDILSNDMLSWGTLSIEDIHITLTGAYQDIPGISLNEYGHIVVLPAAQTGTYSFWYILCEKKFLDNCQSTEVTLHRTSFPASSSEMGTGAKQIISAHTDSLKAFNNEENILPLLENDIFKDRIPNPKEIDIHLQGTGTIMQTITINSEGNLVIPAHSAEGLYLISYTICEKGSIDTCSTAPISIQLYTPPQGISEGGAWTPASTQKDSIWSSAVWGGGWGSSSTQTSIIPSVSRTPLSPSLTPYISKNTSLFAAPSISGQCVSSIKNLTDLKLIAYYDELHIFDRSNVNRPLTRAEFVKLIVHAGNINTSKDFSEYNLSTFADIDKDSWYVPYIAVMIRTGSMQWQEIIDREGKVVKVFRPNDMISRAEASKVLSNLLIKDASELPKIHEIATFKDVNPNSSLAPYIQYAYDNCLLHGRNTLDGKPIQGVDRIFEWYDSITLGETSKILYNMTHVWIY